MYTFPMPALCHHNASFLQRAKKYMAIRGIFQKNSLHVVIAPSTQGVAWQLMTVFSPKTVIGFPHEITKFGRSKKNF